MITQFDNNSKQNSKIHRKCANFKKKYVLFVLKMGLTKQYLRFAAAAKFNIISSSNCNARFVSLNGRSSRHVAAGAAEDVIVWDTKLSKKVLVIEGDKYESVRLCYCPQTQQLAVGYWDGTVNVYCAKTGENLNTFAGHNSSITALAFDSEGHRLATGSNDTDVLIWDVVGEQGLFRLNGHRGPITQVQFMKSRNILVSSSKDTLIKFWDLNNGHCFQTLAGHVTEVWNFCLMKDDTYLVTGTNDNELRVWRINDVVDEKTEDGYQPIVCEKAGSVLRHGLGRVVSMAADQSARILCCHGNEKLLEVFHFVSDEEAEARYRKKRKKLKKKRLEGKIDDQNEDIPSSSLVFRVSRLPEIKTRSKIKSVDVSFENESKIKMIVSLNNNTLEMHSLATESKEGKFENAVSNVGHNSDVRSLAFGEEGSVVSGSSTGIKVWNMETFSCIRTVETEYVLTVCFAPGDRFVLAGLKNGSLLIIDLSSGEIVETVEAHEKELWRISTLPNKMGCITCSSDCTVKIWNFELMKNEQFSSTVLSLLHTKTLKLSEPVLDVRVTPDCNLITAALLDSTVQIFFMDSLKFFLTLYGHKLPVTCLDVSYDSTIISTGSADCSVKIWGLDYGDCHKSTIAHKMAVTSLCFMPKTHYFFTCGKDGAIHQWDADNYERIQTLRGHYREAWGLCVSPDGQLLVSCGQDRVIRVYEKTLEPLVLEDERESERQQEEEETLATGEQSVIYGRTAMLLASKKTVNAEKGAELLLECLDTIKEYKKALQENASTPIPQIMVAFSSKTPDEYLLNILKKIRCSDLEEILSLLPLSSVSELIENLLALLRKMNQEVELIARVLVFLLRAHHKPIVSSRNLFLILKQLQKISPKRIKEVKDTVGYNLHVLYHIQREKELENSVQLFEELYLEQKQKDRKRKKKEKVAATAILKL